MQLKDINKAKTFQRRIFFVIGFLLLISGCNSSSDEAESNLIGLWISRENESSGILIEKEKGSIVVTSVEISKNRLVLDSNPSFWEIDEYDSVKITDISGERICIYDYTDNLLKVCDTEYFRTKK